MLSRIFVRVQFDNKNYLLSEKKLLLSGDIELNSSPAEIPNPLTYHCGFMCSSSTHFWNVVITLHIIYVGEERPNTLKQDCFCLE